MALAGIFCIVCIKLPLLIKKVRVLFGWEDGSADDEVQPDAVQAMGAATGAATGMYGAMVGVHKQTLKRVETKRVDSGGVAADEEHGDDGGGDDDGGD